MKRFLAVYIGTAAAMERSGWGALTAEERQARQKAGVEAWDRWVTTHRDFIVDVGAPLGKTKRVSERGIEDTKNEVVAYAVVEAESHEAAARLFEGHPHFTVFPGDSVEIMECLPIPRR